MRRRSAQCRNRTLLAWAVVVAVVALMVSACSHGSAGHRPTSAAATVGGGSSSGAVPSSGAGAPAGSPSAGRATPTAGTTPSIVASQRVTTLPAVPIQHTAAFGTGLSVQVSKVAHGVSTATGRGALGGRSTVSLTLVLSNGSARAITIDTVQVTMTYGASRTPAVPSTGAGTKAFAGSLRAGRTATGIYQFLVPQADQHDVNVTVWYRSGTPSVLLRGSVQ